MSIDTWHKDWIESPDYNKLKQEDEIRLYEKFVDRIEEIIETYNPEEYKHIEPTKEELENIIKDLEYEVENLKEGIEEV